MNTTTPPQDPELTQDELAENEPVVPEEPITAEAAEAANEPVADEWKDRYLRLSAEFDNFRKRTNREKEQIGLIAAENLMKALLPVVDDLNRSLKAAETSDNIEKIREGLSLVSKNFLTALQKQGIEPIVAKGQPFDSDKHEAIAALPVDEAERKGIVIDEVETGYTYHGKVIRYAKVVTGQ